MFKKGILATAIVLLSAPLMADENNYENKYIMTGITLSNAQEQSIQGINIEYNWIDYTQHYTEATHKHQLNGFGIKINTDDTKFDNEYSDVRELGLYGKRGFELEENGNLFALASLGVGLVETSKPKSNQTNTTSESQLISGTNTDIGIENPLNSDNPTTDPESPDGGSNNEDNNDNVGDATTGNPNTDEKISLSAEVGLGLGYYSRDGSYAASVEVLGQYYEKGSFDPAVRVMFGWKF